MQAIFLDALEVIFFFFCLSSYKANIDMAINKVKKGKLNTMVVEIL